MIAGQPECNTTLDLAKALQFDVGLVCSRAVAAGQSAAGQPAAGQLQQGSLRAVCSRAICSRAGCNRAVCSIKHPRGAINHEIMVPRRERKVFISHLLQLLM